MCPAIGKKKPSDVNQSGKKVMDEKQSKISANKAFMGGVYTLD